MASKKAGTYGETMIVGRRLGRHLPRIASGDAPEDVDYSNEQDKTEEPPPPVPPVPSAPALTALEERRARRLGRDARLRELPPVDVQVRSVPPSPSTPFYAAGKLQHRDSGIVTPSSSIGDAHDVAGIPGRLRLARDQVPSTPASPLPSARLTRGLWADVQRHLLQAYEYLCHVGEAQQWIEGCLGEELGFGVVEMEEGLRNGVVLAKLVRVFQGESAVRRIYDVRCVFSVLVSCSQRLFSGSQAGLPTFR